MKSTVNRIFDYYMYKLLLAAKVSSGNTFSYKTLLPHKVVWMTPMLKLLRDKMSTE